MSHHGVIFMQHWSKANKRLGEPCPVGTARHAAVCLNYGEDQPQIFIFGGKDAGDNVLSDGWILDVQSGKWREVSSLLTCCFVLCDTFYTHPSKYLSILTTHYSGTSERDNPSAKDTLMSTKN